MLFIGEQVGVALPGQPEIDIAVDPLEGTNLVAMGLANAITVLAASEKGGLLNAPDTYMEKLCVGPIAAGHVDIRLSPVENLKLIAEALGRKIADLTIVILDRERHATLIEQIRGAGARIKLISDGDLSAAVSCAVMGTGVHAVMGTWRRSRGCAYRGRAALPGRRDPGAASLPQRRGAASAERMGTSADEERVYTTSDLAPARHLFSRRPALPRVTC